MWLLALLCTVQMDTHSIMIAVSSFHGCRLNWTPWPLNTKEVTLLVPYQILASVEEHMVGDQGTSGDIRKSTGKCGLGSCFSHVPEGWGPQSLLGLNRSGFSTGRPQIIMIMK